MLKYFLFTILNIFLIFNIVYSFSGGDGSLSNPYNISNCTQLQNISSSLDANYQLISDIDCNIAPYNVSSGFNPIGTSANPFTGDLNGNGYVISQLYINRGGQNYVGLFGRISSGAVVSNFSILNAQVIGNDRTGILIGENSATVSYVQVSGSVTGRQRVGGLAGHNGNSISYTSSSATVTASSTYSGGLIGYHSYASVSNSYATGDVVGQSTTGGLIGDGDGGSALNVFATGNVQGTSRTGGLFGWSDTTTTNGFASGNVSSNSNQVGGLIGFMQGRTHTNLFYVGENVSGTSEVGFIVGRRSGGSFTNSYVNNISTNTLALFGSGPTGGVNVINENISYFLNSSNEPLRSWNSNIWNFTGTSLPYISYFDNPNPSIISNDIQISSEAITNPTTQFPYSSLYILIILLVSFFFY